MAEDAQTSTNEGHAGVKGQNSVDGSKSVVGDGVGQKKGPKMVDKWLDSELVKRKVVRQENGKLGIAREGGKVENWRSYAGKTFDELEDLVPLAGEIGSVHYEVASVFWLVCKRFTVKGYFRLEDIGVLMMMYRMQVASAGSFFTRAMLALCFSHNELKPRAHTLVRTNTWVKRMRAKGLIEQIPGLKVYDGRKIAMFRLSLEGRTVLAQFLAHLRELHKDIRYWVKNYDFPEREIDYLRRYVMRYTIGVDEEITRDPDGNPETLEDMVQLTKADIRRMGAKQDGYFYKDLPDK